MAAEAGLDFLCKYCDKKFRNKYALGGHQNAHRFERAMDWTLKRNRRRGFIDYYPPFSPFAGFPALAGAGGYWNQAAAMQRYFRAGYRIPSPEILVRPLPVEYRPRPQVLPPAMNIPGDNTFAVGSGSVNSAVTPIAINSNPRNAPEMMEDGELDLNELNLKL